MVIPNITLFTNPVTMSRRKSASSDAWMYRTQVKSACATPTSAPPRIPMEFAQIVRHGSITIMARNFGVTRKSTGCMAIVSSASISSETFIVPISAANAEPERPITTIAVMSGPSSLVIEMATAFATKVMAPSFRSSYALCSARIKPIKNVMRERIGSARTPTCIACEMACRSRSGLPRKGATNVKYAARPPSEASPPRYAMPSTTEPPICDVSSMTFHGPVPRAGFGALGRHRLFFAIRDLKNPEQLGKLKNLSHGGAQTKQNKARAYVARCLETFDQGCYAGAVRVANLIEVQHDTRRA